MSGLICWDLGGVWGGVEDHIQSLVNEKDYLAAKRGFSACSSLS